MQARLQIMRARPISKAIRYRYATQNHPSEEHLLPLFVALGAAGEDGQAHRECAGFLYGSLAMDSYSFDASS